MTKCVKQLLVCSILAFLLIGAPGLIQKADAGVVSIPILFPPISECGTVDVVPSTFPFPDDDPENVCIVWRADSNNAAFLVSGIESFEVGDRVFVEGQICLFCLTTCQAGAILNSTVSECPVKGDFATAIGTRLSGE